MRAPKLYAPKKPRKSRDGTFLRLCAGRYVYPHAYVCAARLALESASTPADADFKQNAARKCAVRRKYDSHSG